MRESENSAYAHIVRNPSSTSPFPRKRIVPSKRTRYPSIVTLDGHTEIETTINREAGILMMLYLNMQARRHT